MLYALGPAPMGAGQFVFRKEVNVVRENPVRVWRQHSGLGLAELARKLGISYHQAWRLEAGHVVSVSLRVAERLAELGFPGDVAEAYQRWREAV